MYFYCPYQDEIRNKNRAEKFWKYFNFIDEDVWLKKMA